MSQVEKRGLRVLSQVEEGGLRFLSQVGGRGLRILSQVKGRGLWILYFVEIIRRQIITNCDILLFGGRPGTKSITLDFSPECAKVVPDFLKGGTFLAHSVMHHSFIFQWRAEELQYVTVPKAMLKAAPRLGLAADEILMYRVIQSRCELSYRNHWVDENGNIYVVFTRDQAAGTMKWSYNKAAKVFKRLQEAGLIYEVEQRGENNLRKAKRTYARFWDGTFGDEDDFGHGLLPEEIKSGMLPVLTAANIGLGTGSYYVIPRVLLESTVYEDLSIGAKLLYVIALDSLQASIRYGMVDEHDIPFCILKPERVCQELQCSHRTLTRYYKELTDIGLIERRKRGFAPDLSIYLRDFGLTEEERRAPVHTCEAEMRPYVGSLYSEPEPPLGAEVAKNAERGSQICGTTSPDLRNEVAKNDERGSQKCVSTSPKMTTSQPVKLSYLSDPSLSVSLQARTRAHADAHASNEATEAPLREKEEILRKALNSTRTQLEYPELLMDIERRYKAPQELELARQLVNKGISMMAHDYCSQAPYIRIGNRDYAQSDLVSFYQGITRYHFETMIDKIVDRIDSIKHVDSYLHRSLVDAYSRHDAESYYVEIEAKERAAKAGTAEYARTPSPSATTSTTDNSSESAQDAGQAQDNDFMAEYRRKMAILALRISNGEQPKSDASEQLAAQPEQASSEQSDALSRYETTHEPVVSRSSTPSQDVSSLKGTRRSTDILAADSSTSNNSRVPIPAQRAFEPSPTPSPYVPGHICEQGDERSGLVFAPASSQSLDTNTATTTTSPVCPKQDSSVSTFAQELCDIAEEEPVLAHSRTQPDGQFYRKAGQDYNGTAVQPWLPIGSSRWLTRSRGQPKTNHRTSPPAYGRAGPYPSSTRRAQTQACTVHG